MGGSTQIVGKKIPIPVQNLLKVEWRGLISYSPTKTQSKNLYQSKGESYFKIEMTNEPCKQGEGEWRPMGWHGTTHHVN